VKKSNLILTSILISSLLIGTIRTVRVTGQNGSKAYNGHEYKLITNNLTWLEAKEDCEKLGGYLVTIANPEENEFVASLVEFGVATIGISDKDVEGEWVWITNEPVTYTNWLLGKPNDAEFEDYVGITIQGIWFNVHESQQVPYICEWDFIDYKEEISSLVFLFERILIFAVIIITLIFMKRTRK
jgi:hypothetical protein